MKRLLIAAGLVAFALATPALASAPKFTATCPTGITVKSNGSGTVRINGKKASVKTFNANAWEATSRGVTIDITREGSDVTLTYTAKGGANGICQLTSSSSSDASSAAAAGGAPSKDEQACLAAASNAANNGEVAVLSTSTSEANNIVMIGVGEQRAPWKCLVKNGKVAEISSQADEGAN